MLRTLEIWGEPEARGRRHGQTLGADIRLLRRAVLTYLARISLYAGALPLYGLLKWLARGFWPYIPPHLQQEMVALAAGAEVSLGSILLLNVVDDLANNSPRCSALAVGDSRTGQGAYVMGRNLDYPVFTEPLTELQTLFLIEPHRGQRLASLAWPGYVGVCTGINAAGVALAQLSAMSRDRTLKGTPAALRFRQALEDGDTVNAVAARVLEAPGTIGNNLMLCGPREALVLEISARQGAVRRPENGLLTATNHYQSPAMQGLKGRFPAPAPLFRAGGVSIHRGLQPGPQPAPPGVGLRPPPGSPGLTKNSRRPRHRQCRHRGVHRVSPRRPPRVGGPGQDPPGEPGTL